MLGYDRAMSRYAWIVVSLAALVGVLAPLCTLTCSESLPTAAVAAVDERAGEMPPCHGADPAAPENAPSDERPCDCDRTELIATSPDGSKALDPPGTTGTFVARADSGVPIGSGAHFRFAYLPRHLPPHDILLSKSTLLI